MKNLSLPLFFLILLSSCSRDLYLGVKSGPEHKSATSPAQIIAPDLKILKDWSFGPSIPGALTGLKVVDTLVLASSRMHRVYHVDTGWQRVAQYPCTITNQATHYPGTDPCAYSFALKRQSNRYYESMIRVEVWQDGNVFHDTIKSIYVLSIYYKPGSDFSYCDASKNYTDSIYINMMGADYYEAFAPLKGIDTSRKYSIKAWINWAKVHLEQDDSEADNSVLITAQGSTIYPDDSTALQPIAPHSFTYKPAPKGQVTISWQGSGEWYEIQGIPGRLLSASVTLKRNRTVDIRSVNRYKASAWVEVTARK